MEHINWKIWNSGHDGRHQHQVQKSSVSLSPSCVTVSILSVFTSHGCLHPSFWNWPPKRHLQCIDRWSDAAAQVTWQHFKHSICILFLKTLRFTHYSFRAFLFFIYCFFFVFLFCLIIDSGGKYLHRFQRSPLRQLLLSLSLKWTEGCINGSQSAFGFLFIYFFSKENSTIISRFFYQFFDRNFSFFPSLRDCAAF